MELMRLTNVLSIVHRPQNPGVLLLCVLRPPKMLPFVLAALAYGIGHRHLDSDEIPALNDYHSCSRRKDIPHHAPRLTMDGSFVIDPNPRPPTYRLASRKTRYRTVTARAGTAPRVTNPVAADEMWQKVEMPVDEDTHTVRRGLLASVMKVDDDDDDDDDYEVPPQPRERKEKENLKTIHMPKGLCMCPTNLIWTPLSRYAPNNTLAASNIKTDLIRTLTGQLKYMRFQAQACETQQDREVVEGMVKNLESALSLAEDMGRFVKQIEDGKRGGVVEVHTERGCKDVGKGRVGLDWR